MVRGSSRIQASNSNASNQVHACSFVTYSKVFLAQARHRPPNWLSPANLVCGRDPRLTNLPSAGPLRSPEYTTSGHSGPVRPTGRRSALIEIPLRCVWPFYLWPGFSEHPPASTQRDLESLRDGPEAQCPSRPSLALRSAATVTASNAGLRPQVAGVFTSGYTGTASEQTEGNRRCRDVHRFLCHSFPST